MTRPMPEPLECTCMSRGNSCWTCVDTIGWDPEEECPSCPVHAGSAYSETKRLTDAECYDEWEAAEEDAWDALADHIRGDKQGHAARFDRSKNAALTWARFATRPHALEEA